MPKPLFIGGTASHVGKSWFTTAFCRLLQRRGVRVAPFKGQNMSNNSHPTIEGGEIGRAQAVQAEACRLPAMADMNPVLLKPNSNTGSQVVVNGKVWRTIPAREYYQHSGYLFEQVLESYARLAAQFDQVVCEGAGSIAEVNLQARDITNMRLAEAIGANVLLVADIERGGVFASVLGTIELLPPHQRKLIKAFAINQFRGDLQLFNEGRSFLEQRLGIPCLGVFPKDPAIRIPEEDSLGIPISVDSAIAVIRLPRISNFTDFQNLGPIEWLEAPKAKQFRIVFLPGTKNTVEDLLWLRSQGLDQWLLKQHEQGALIVGICGGYQMLGRSIADPEGLESPHGEVPGLNLLPVDTTLKSPKLVRSINLPPHWGRSPSAYEIHMGTTTSFEEGVVPFIHLADGQPDGCCKGRVFGTYLHGILEEASPASDLLGLQIQPNDRHFMYDRLADWLIEHSSQQVLEEFLR